MMMINTPAVSAMKHSVNARTHHAMLRGIIVSKSNTDACASANARTPSDSTRSSADLAIGNSQIEASVMSSAAADARNPGNQTRGYFRRSYNAAQQSAVKL